MRDDKAIVFVGMPGAGKSVCMEYLKNKGLPCVYFGGITLDEAKQRGLAINEKNEKLVREDIRAQEGKGAYAARIAKQIKDFFAKGQGYVVVDGLYSWTEYKIFKQDFGPKAVIIAIIAPEKVRHERLAKRQVRPLTNEDAAARDYAEIENLEKGGPIANADYFLLNDGATEDLQANLQQLLTKIGINV